MDNEQQINSNNTNQIKKTLTEEEIIAQCILFFVAGFETTASTISHALYNLAFNPDVQERLYKELCQALDCLEDESNQYNEVITSGTGIPYLDAVIKETLRKYPPLTRLERRVSTDGYKLGSISLKKGSTVQIGVMAVHYNPEYYPEPERFMPDRFMPENKHNILPYTYLPFGVGPRNCIGMRFAYQEIRLCLAKIIRQFRFEPTADTPIPTKFDLSKLGLLSTNTIPLKVSRR